MTGGVGAVVDKKDLRPYQQEAMDALWWWLRANKDGGACVVVPTGGGKSLLIAEVTKRVVAGKGRVLVLANRAELIEQNAAEISSYTPDARVGIIAAKLKQRTPGAEVTVAAVQSLHRIVHELPRQDLVIVDEAHTLMPSGEGQVASIVAAVKEKNPRARVVGLTATPYRMGSGLICGPDNIFTEIVYEANILDLIKAGYLAPLRNKAAVSTPDLSKVRVRNGEFVAGEMEAVYDHDALTRDAIAEMELYGQGRKRWLVFAAGVAHARSIARIMKSRGHDVGCVVGDTPTEERREIIERFRAGTLKTLVGCEVFTTGFNVPSVDLIAVMRATMSPGLWVQMVGRGARNAPEKKDCLVLDYGGNCGRHGPIDLIRVSRREKSGVETAPTKTCPECREVIPAGARECPECHYVYPDPTALPPVIDREASTAPLLSTDIRPETYTVERAEYLRHEKKEGTPSMRVKYWTGNVAQFSDWVCFEHSGFPRKKAIAWWRGCGGYDPAPKTVDEALSRVQELFKPREIEVTKDGQYFRVTRVRLSAEREMPLAAEEDPLEAFGYNI